MGIGEKELVGALVACGDSMLHGLDRWEEVVGQKLKTREVVGGFGGGEVDLGGSRWRW